MEPTLCFFMAECVLILCGEPQGQKNAPNKTKNIKKKNRLFLPPAGKKKEKKKAAMKSILEFLMLVI